MKYTGGTFGIEYDTDVDGANLTGITAQRWLGFVLTDSSGDICNFEMSGDSFFFKNATDGAIVSPNIPTTYTSYSYASLCPVDRVDYVTIFSLDDTEPIRCFMSPDGVTGQTMQEATVEFRDGWYIKSTGTTYDTGYICISKVALKR